MTVPHETEAALLTELGDEGETVVAFALLPMKRLTVLRWEKPKGIS